MALINCPECNNEVSDKVRSCPHCGYSLKKKQPRIDISKLKQIPIRFTKKSISIIAIAVAAIITLVIVYNVAAPGASFNIYSQGMSIYDRAVRDINQANTTHFGINMDNAESLLKEAETKEDKIFVAALFYTLDKGWTHLFASAIQYDTSESNQLYKNATKEKEKLISHIEDMGKLLSTNNTWKLSRYAKEYDKDPKYTGSILTDDVDTNELIQVPAKEESMTDEEYEEYLKDLLGEEKYAQLLEQRKQYE